MQSILDLQTMLLIFQIHRAFEIKLTGCRHQPNKSINTKKSEYCFTNETLGTLIMRQANKYNYGSEGEQCSTLVSSHLIVSVWCCQITKEISRFYLSDSVTAFRTSFCFVFDNARFQSLSVVEQFRTLLQHHLWLFVLQLYLIVYCSFSL